MPDFDYMRNNIVGFGPEIKNQEEIHSMRENRRLMGESVDYSRWTLIISIIALFVSLASLIVAIIALLK